MSDELNPRVLRVRLFIHLADIAAKTGQYPDVVQDNLRRALDIIDAYPDINWDAEMERIDKLNPQ